MSLLPVVSRERNWAYVLLRALTGLDFFGHGFARVFTGTHISGFAQGMAKSMAGTPLPVSLVLATGYIVPFLELLIGVLLLVGAGVRVGLFAALALMFVLMFGITLKQDWATAGMQLQYGLVLAALVFGRAGYDVPWSKLLRHG